MSRKRNVVVALVLLMLAFLSLPRYSRVSPSKPPQIVKDSSKTLLEFTLPRKHDIKVDIPGRQTLLDLLDKSFINLSHQDLWDNYDLKLHKSRPDPLPSLEKLIELLVLNYEKIYGRSPPPRFDTDWIPFALENKCSLNNSYYNVIDGDLKPFRLVKDLYNVAKSLHGQIAMASCAFDPPEFKEGMSAEEYKKLFDEYQGNPTIWQGWNWNEGKYADLLSRFKKYLPKVFLPINNSDEPRVMVNPRSGISLKLAQDTTAGMYKGWEDWGHATMGPNGDHNGMTIPQRIGEWCKSDSGENVVRMGFAGQALDDGTSEVHFHPSSETSSENITGNSSDADWFKHHENDHGILLSPDHLYLTRGLYPILSATRFQACSSDIRHPIFYHIERDKYEVNDEIPFEEKQDVVHWRGGTTGGHSRPNNWNRFHRHRLVLALGPKQLENGSTIVPADSDPELTVPGIHWDVQFVLGPGMTSAHGELTKAFLFAGQEHFMDNFKYKYLIDMDGNSYSTRFLRFVQSKSVIFRGTLMEDWYDEAYLGLRGSKNSLVMPGRDYISVEMPMEKHIAKAVREVTKSEESIREWGERAKKRSEWSKKRLRVADMECFMFRLILELAEMQRVQ